MKTLHEVLANALRDLTAVGADCALVGGLAVGVRSEPRFTRDVDLAVALRSDVDAESLIHALLSRGYRLEMLIEHRRAQRLGTARLVTPYHREVFLKGASIRFVDDSDPSR